MHVSIISFGSFSGRLISGIGSDFLVSKLHRSRFWCLFVSASTFCMAQFVATRLENPNLLVLVSGLTGLAYGMLFGVYPSLVANTFGVRGMSQNWGTMCLAPVISGNIFNIFYGKIYDGQSIINKDGDRECLQGRECYSKAYWVTFGAAILGMVVCAYCIWHENQAHRRNSKEKRRMNHERSA